MSNKNAKGQKFYFNDHIANKLKKVRESVKGSDFDTKKFDKEMEELRKKNYLNTQTANEWEELVRQVVYKDEICSLIAEESALLPMLPCSHGDGLAPQQVISIKWELPLFSGAVEPTTAAPVYGDLTPSEVLPTDKIQINQGKF